MPVMDEFREERDAIKQKSLKERLQYFFDYYKWHTVAVVVLVAAAVSLIHSMATRKEWAFYGAFVNAYQTPQYDEFREDFAERADIDLEKYEVLFDTDMFITGNAFDQGSVDATERLTVYIAAGDVDVMASGPQVADRYAYNGMFRDLRQVLPQELQTQLEPYYYYMDAALADEIESAQNAGVSETAPSYPTDPSQAGDMRDPIPVGLYIQDCPRIQEAFIFQEDDVILSVIANTTETDSVLQLIRMIYEIES